MKLLVLRAVAEQARRDMKLSAQEPDDVAAHRLSGTCAQLVATVETLIETLERISEEK